MEINVSTARITECRTRIRNLLSSADTGPLDSGSLNIEDMQPLDIDATEKELEKTASGAQAIRNRQEEIQQEINKYRDMERQLALYARSPDFLTGRSGEKESGYSFLTVKVGAVPSSAVPGLSDRLAGYPSVHTEMGSDGNLTGLLVVCLKRDDKPVARILEECGWHEGLPRTDGTENGENISEGVMGNLKKTIESLQEKQEKKEEWGVPGGGGAFSNLSTSKNEAKVGGAHPKRPMELCKK